MEEGAQPAIHVAVYEKIDKFKLYEQDWEGYIERLEFYFVANKITEAKMKSSILLSACGSKTYSLVRNLVLSRKPGDVEYVDIVKIFENQLKPR